MQLKINIPPSDQYIYYLFLLRPLLNEYSNGFRLLKWKYCFISFSIMCFSFGGQNRVRFASYYIFSSINEIKGN